MVCGSRFAGIGVATRMKERRTARRYDLPLVIAIVPPEEKAIFRIGKIRDISTRAIYFTIDQDLNAGAKLELTITLSAEVTGATEVLIKATGTIVRVDKRRGNGGQMVDVAAICEMYEFVRNKAVVA
jgi:hypothetical protein